MWILHFKKHQQLLHFCCPEVIKKKKPKTLHKVLGHIQVHCRALCQSLSEWSVKCCQLQDL